jgi:hypothetical protein
MALVRERTIPTERPPPFGEVTLNYYIIKQIKQNFSRLVVLLNLDKRSSPVLHILEIDVAT